MNSESTGQPPPSTFRRPWTSLYEPAAFKTKSTNSGRYYFSQKMWKFLNILLFEKRTRRSLLAPQFYCLGRKARSIKASRIHDASKLRWVRNGILRLYLQKEAWSLTRTKCWIHQYRSSEVWSRAKRKMGNTIQSRDMLAMYRTRLYLFSSSIRS